MEKVFLVLATNKGDFFSLSAKGPTIGDTVEIPGVCVATIVAVYDFAIGYIAEVVSRVAPVYGNVKRCDVQ